MDRQPQRGYREASPPLLRTYRLRLRGWHLLALLVTVVGLSLTIAAVRYGVVVLPCIIIWIPGLYYALTSAFRSVSIYADRVDVVRSFRPPLRLPMRELELREWPYGVEMVAGEQHVKLVPQSFGSKDEFDHFVELLSRQLDRR